MRGIRLRRRGMDCLVRGMKGSSVSDEKVGEVRFVGRVVLESEGWVVVKVD